MERRENIYINFLEERFKWTSLRNFGNKPITDFARDIDISLFCLQVVALFIPLKKERLVIVLAMKGAISVLLILKSLQQSRYILICG